VFSLLVAWDTTELELVDTDLPSVDGWTLVATGHDTPDPEIIFMTVQGSTGINDYHPTSDSRFWATITFKCLAPGEVLIGIPEDIYDNHLPNHNQYSPLVFYGSYSNYALTLWSGVAKQRLPVPSTPQHVGGELYSANKLAVLSPYLALLSVVAVAAVLVKRRKI
jgi:hypothetical protein